MVKTYCGVLQTTITVGVLTAVGTGVVAYLYNRYRNRNKVPTEWTAVGKVQKLCIYPLKSGRRTDMSEAECTVKGLMEVGTLPGSFRLRDRAFLIYHGENFEHRTATTFSKLVVISVEHWENDGVLFKAPGLQDLKFKIPQVEREKSFYIIGFRKEKFRAIDCGDEAAKWISIFISGKDAKYRIAYFDKTYNRNQIPKLFSNLPYVKERGLRNESAGIHSNLTAVMLVNEASSTEILKTLGEPEITIDNFRANIVVSGPDLQPYAEDNWMWIKIGDIVLKNVADCIRCVSTTINTETGERRLDREPLRILKKLRGVGPNNTPLMGIKLEVNQTGFLSVGDIVYVAK